MVVLSLLRNFQPLLTKNIYAPSFFIKNTNKKLIINGIGINKKCMSSAGHKRVMVIKPSTFQWAKFKDAVHFYVMLGAIPLTTLVFFVNIFVGPAELADIPEGYDPKPWEYHKHPIKRWFARYVYASPQQEYELHMHVIKEEWDKQRLRLLERKVKRLMRDRNDYRAWYYQPFTAKYLRRYRTQSEELQEEAGRN